MKLLKSVIVYFLLLMSIIEATKNCPNSKRINSKLICYYSKLINIDNNCYCTHVILPVGTDLKSIELLRPKLNGAKILLTVTHFNQDLIDTVKQNSVDGFELNLSKLSSKNDIADLIDTVRTKLGDELYLTLAVPPKTELLAKYYDFKTLSKSIDLFVLQTSFLGVSKNATFHPSRLSGLWDIQNTDSVVDLATGLGAPLSKLAITVPVQAYGFKLQDKRFTTPGSPALELKSLTRQELCTKMNSGSDWMLERDQDQAGPYIFRDTNWISFEDEISMDIKAKYSRVRGLAGLALKDLSQDLPSQEEEDSKCGISLLKAAYTGLSKQTRAPRGAVLKSLEREIRQTPATRLDTIHVSPYRISRVIDVEGHIHAIRQDTRTEFECSRQGYFVHPHSCGRFYRCVKFDQHSDEFTVFEFDCPAGLAFDNRVEVCVWPGSLEHGAPCTGSSEIAPVPRQRFICPATAGYYADPENCRWFFACLDHGSGSGLTAYEFRCPFGLVFDEVHLVCEWPWLVPSCKSGTVLEIDSIEFFGGVARSKIIYSAEAGSQIHGAQILDNYNGLGSLGVVTLGGYSGDLNLLKQNHESTHSYNYEGNAGYNLHEQGQVNLINANLQTGSKLAQGAYSNVNLHEISNSANIENSHLNNLRYNQNAGYINEGLSNEKIYLGNGYQSSGDQLTLVQVDEGRSSNNYKQAEGIVQFGTKLEQPNVVGVINGPGYVGYQGVVNSGAKSSQFDNYYRYDNAKEAQLVDLGAKSGQSILQIHSNAAAGEVGNLQQEQYQGRGDYQYIQPVITQTYSTSHAANVGGFQQYNSYDRKTDSNLTQKQYYGIGAAPIVSFAPKYEEVLTQKQFVPVIQQPAPFITKVEVPLGISTPKYESYSKQIHIQHPIVESVSVTPKYEQIEIQQPVVPIIPVTPKIPIVPVIPKVEQIHIEQPKLESVSFTSNYATQHFGTKLKEVVQPIVYETPKVEVPISVTPAPIITKFEYIQRPVVQSLPIISVTPKYETYKVPLVQPKVEPVSFSSNFATQHFNTKSKEVAHSVLYEDQIVVTPKIPVVPIVPRVEQVVQPVVYEAPKIEQIHIQHPVSFSSNYATHFDTRLKDVVQPVVYEAPRVEVPIAVTPAPVPIISKVEQVHIQPFIQPKLESASFSSNYATQHFRTKLKEVVQPVVYEAPRVEVPIAVTPAPVPIIPKIEQIHIQQPVIQPNLESVSFSSNYATQHFGTKLKEVVQPVVYEAPRVEVPIAVTPAPVPIISKVEQIHIQPFIQPKLESASFSSNYATQHFGTKLKEFVQPVVYEAPRVEVPIAVTPAPVPIIPKVEQIHIQPFIQPKLESASFSSNYATQHFGTKLKEFVQPVVYEAPRVEVPIAVTPAPVQIIPKIEQIHIQQPVIQPNLESVSFSSNYATQHFGTKLKEFVQPVVYEAPRVEVPIAVTPAPVAIIPKVEQIHIQHPTISVTPKYETYNNYFSNSKSTYYGSHAHDTIISSPKIVETYNYLPPKQIYVSSTPRPAHSKITIFQDYVQPQIIKTVTPAPAIIQTYNYIPPKPVIKYESRQYLPPPISTTPKYTVVQEYIQPQVVKSVTPAPAVIESYSYLPPKQPATVKYESRQYLPPISSPKPIFVSTTPKYIAFQEYIQPQVVKTVTPAPAVVESYSYLPPKQPAIIKYESRQYLPPISSPKPIYVSTTPKYTIFQEYVQPQVASDESRQYLPSKQTIQSMIVNKYNYENEAYSNSNLKSNFYEIQHQQIPAIPIETNYIVSTPKPTFITTIAPVIKQTPRIRTKIVAITTPKVETPSFSYYDSRYHTSSGQHLTETSDRLYQFGQKQEIPYVPVTEYIVSSPKPTIVTTIAPIVKQTPRVKTKIIAITTPKDILLPFKYYDSRYQTNQEQYLKETSNLDGFEIKKNFVTTTPVPIITTTSTQIPFERYESVKLITPKPKTIVRVNDFHPFLTSKLGAQCTCVSNTVKLRKRPKPKVEIEEEIDYDYNVPITKLTSDGVASYDDYNEPGVYVVGNSDEYGDYDSKKIAVTKTPEVVIKATTNAIQPAPTPVYVSRKRITTIKPIVVEDVYLSEDKSKEEKIAEAVNEGLSLVKSAIKGYVKEAIAEETHKFDRFGPGGWRSRDETLQGSVDCQRAGLFRHPTQCNKFYACHWDCTKNRYTLHVFNCPVHLTFDVSQGACNWPSKGPACADNTLLPHA